jgi:putative SOS response-associated peptidase YedK
MCGRFVRHTKPSVYATLFEVDPVPGGPSYNIAPTQPVAAVRVQDRHRECVLMRWGLVPSWSKDGKPFINARGETVATKPTFRGPFKRRHCLILADGYYEWKPTGGKVKQPYYYHLRDDQAFAFAGLWDQWTGPEGPIETCAIITTEANDLAKAVHDRMPVILNAETGAAWLDPQADTAELQKLLRPYAGGDLDAYPVSTRVNSPRHQGPELIQRLAS